MVNKVNQLSLPVEFGFLVVALESIVYIKSDGNFSKVYFLDQTYKLISKQLKAFEEFLPESFLRIHNKYLINKSFVKSFNKKDLQVNLSTGVKLPVSVRRKKLVYEAFNLIK